MTCMRRLIRLMDEWLDGWMNGWLDGWMDGSASWMIFVLSASAYKIKELVVVVYSWGYVLLQVLIVVVVIVVVVVVFKGSQVYCTNIIGITALCNCC